MKGLTDLGLFQSPQQLRLLNLLKVASKNCQAKVNFSRVLSPQPHPLTLAPTETKMGKRKHSHGGAMVGISDPVFTPPNAPLSKNNYSCDTCGVRLKDWDPKKILRCIRCAEEIDCWHKATSWSELLQYNREFVRNKRRSTAYAFNQQVFRYPGLTNSLLRLHDYGCL